MKYPPQQIRSLMDVLAVLAHIPESEIDGSNTFSAEFSILLRKQLTHNSNQIRCFGVLATIATIRQLSAMSKVKIGRSYSHFI